MIINLPHHTILLVWQDEHFIKFFCTLKYLKSSKKSANSFSTLVFKTTQSFNKTHVKSSFIGCVNEKKDTVSSNYALQIVLFSCRKGYIGSFARKSKTCKNHLKLTHLLKYCSISLGFFLNQYGPVNNLNKIPRALKIDIKIYMICNDKTKTFWKN